MFALLGLTPLLLLQPIVQDRLLRGAVIVRGASDKQRLSEVETATI